MKHYFLNDMKNYAHSCQNIFDGLSSFDYDMIICEL